MKLPSQRNGVLKGFPWASLGRRETGAEFLQKMGEQRERVRLFSQRPKFSIVLTVSEGVSPAHLQESVESIRQQSYPDWELVLVEASEAPSEAERKRLGGARASGDWVGFLRAGDVLSPATLFQLACEWQKSPDTDVFYTNEVTVDTASKTLSRFLSKAEFSQFNLWHFNSIGSFWAMRRSLYEQLGGLDAGLGDFAEHDLCLRAAEHTSRFRHVPFFFYHRRQSAKEPVPKQALVERVGASLQRANVSADVVVRECGGEERVKVVPALPNEKPLISAVICFRDKAEWTLRAAKALAWQVGQCPVELILVDNDSSPEELAKVAAFLPTFPIPSRIVSHPGPFNFGHMHNKVIREHCRGDLLLLLNNDVFLEGERTLDEWAAWAMQPWAGTVGILLRFAHGLIQHSGICAQFGGEARLVRVGHTRKEDSLAHENREVFANTFAACMVKRSAFEAVGGLRELDMPNGFGDVAFNLECLRRGWRNLYLGHLQGTHLESASRGQAYEYWEERALEREYPELLEKMLRCDFGFDRIPAADYSIPHFMGQALKVKLRESTPWLDPIKPVIKKLLWNLQHAGHNPK